MDNDLIKKLHGICQGNLLDKLDFSSLDNEDTDEIIEEWLANIPRQEADEFFENAFINHLDFVENTLLAYTHPEAFAEKIRDLNRTLFFVECREAAYPHDNVAYYLLVENEVNQYFERLAESM